MHRSYLRDDDVEKTWWYSLCLGREDLDVHVFHRDLDSMLSALFEDDVLTAGLEDRSGK